MSDTRDQQVTPEGFKHFFSFFTALRFLTVIPVRYKANYDESLFSGAAIHFPLIGLLIGLIAALGCSLLSLFLPLPVVCFLLVALLSGISGFLHLDGLADSGDGLFSYRPKAKALSIMKDSRTGAMGVILVVLVLLGKYVALSSITSQTLITGTILLLPVAGRCGILLAMATMPYARPEGGIGGLFYSGKLKGVTGGWLIFFILLSSLLLSFKGAVILLITLLLTAGLSCYFCKRRIDGVTGDTLGAICEVTELTVCIAISGLYI